MCSAPLRWVRSRDTPDDLHAVARAMALCAFLWALKVHLAWWFIAVKGVPALDELAWWEVPLLGGGDVILCAGLAPVYAVLFWMPQTMPRWARIGLGTVLPVLLHAAVVVFSTISWQVNLIYATPLEIGHLRSADNIGTMRDSIVAYLGITNVTFLLAGLASYWALGRPIELLLRKAAALRVRWRLWTAAIGCAVLVGCAWLVRMKGVYAWGLKRNAVIHFVQYYQKPAKTLDVLASARAMTVDMKGRENELLEPTSLHVAGGIVESGVRANGSAEGMNLLIILMESTSAQYVDARTTPNLLRLADNALSFSNHFITFAETYKALYGVLYSDYLPNLGGATRDLYGRPLPQRSLVDVLKARGYQTAFYHSGFFYYTDLGYLVEAFDTRVDGTQIQKVGKPWVWGVYEEQTVEALSRWIAANKDRPFFAVYSTIFPHHPYISPMKDKPFPGDTWANKYRNSLWYADHGIGRLIDFLDKEKLRDNTLIVVTGDHGETVSSFPVAHGLAMTLEETRVPCILSNPKLFPGRRQTSLCTNHLDLAPTLTRLLGADLAPDWLGRDVLAPQVPARMLFMRMDQGKLLGVVDNGLMYVLDEKSNRSSLYAIGQEQLAALDSADGRNTLMNQYESKARLFTKWAAWRHLKRATGQ